MRLETVQKLRKKLRQISSYWIGIGRIRGNEVEVYAYLENSQNPARILAVVRDEVTLERVEEVKRVPSYVLLLDSAIEEFERAERFLKEGDLIKAAKSFWGTVIYSLKAYGMFAKGCRVVEFSLLDIAKDLSAGDKSISESVRKMQNIMKEQFDLQIDEANIEMLRNYARAIVERTLNELLIKL